MFYVLRRIILIIVGLGAFIIVLEVILRISAGCIEMYRELNAPQRISQEGYTVLCLGESTTEGQWPPFFQKEMNERFAPYSIPVQVIDKGRIGTTTERFVLELPSYLDIYKPDMVIAMMGINDGYFLGKLPPEGSFQRGVMRLMMSMRSYRLWQLLYAHSVRYDKKLADGGNKEWDAQYTDEMKAVDEWRTKIEEGARWFEQKEYEKGETCFQDVFLHAQQPDYAAYFIGIVYQRHNKSNDFFLFLESIHVADAYLPNHYIAIGEVCLDMHDIPLAEKYFEKAINLDRTRSGTYNRIGSAYFDRGMFDESIPYYMQTLEIDSTLNEALYNIILGLQNMQQYGEAHRWIQRGCSSESNEFSYWVALGTLAQNQPGKEYAEYCFQQADKWKKTRSYSRSTSLNYQRIKQMLDARKIKMVCVQYPLRKSRDLRYLLGAYCEGVLFVDNEKVFKEALKKASYGTYFRDIFGGDFGHCTPAGNALLAHNIAEVVWKEYLETQLMNYHKKYEGV